MIFDSQYLRGIGLVPVYSFYRRAYHRTRSANYFRLDSTLKNVRKYKEETLALNQLSNRLRVFL